MNNQFLKNLEEEIDTHTTLLTYLNSRPESEKNDATNELVRIIGFQIIILNNLKIPRKDVGTDYALKDAEEWINIKIPTILETFSKNTLKLMMEWLKQTQ